MPVYFYGKGSAQERFQFWLANLPEALAIDVETVSIQERIPLGFAIAFSGEEAFYFQVYPEPPPELQLLKPLLCNPAVRKVAHNMMFDLGILPTIPFLEQVDRSNLWDTSIAARLLGREIADLPYLANTELNMQVTSARELLGQGKTMLDIEPMVLAEKCQQDAKACFALYLNYLPQIESQHASSFRVDMAVMPILIDMSQKGLAIDKAARDALAIKYTGEMEFYRRQVESFGVDNPGSSRQTGYILAKRGNFLPLTRGRKQLSTREAELEFLDDPMAAAVLGYRKNAKFKGTYLDPLENEDYFYSEYYIDTSVGRLSSRNRNIQNIPPDARHMILPNNGCFTGADYSQEHLRILMHFSGDREMRRVYEDGAYGGDIHKFTADELKISRHLAKTINYAIAYGATAKTISEQAKIKDRHICERLLDNWFRTFKGAADWITYAQREGVRDGWALPTLFGRRIKLPAENEDAMRRKATNFPILGSDGEVIKRAILLCADRGLGPPILAITIHDSLVFDGDVELPVEELEMIPTFRIPIEVKKTIHWE